MTFLAESGERGINRYESKYLLWLPLVNHKGPELRPRLAESWEHSPDYQTWTIHLRDDVRWHDGVPVTAHDVVFSIELFAHPDVLFPGWWMALGADSISVPDDHTITFFFKRPVHDLIGGWVVYFPKHLLEDFDPAEFYEWDFWKRPVGNGPYRFVRHVPQTMFELESNPDFYAGEPAIKRVVIKYGGANPVIELTSGAADVVLSLDAAEVLRFKADPRFIVYHRYDWSVLQLIYWNQRHPLFADASVRLALSHAIDRREMARVLGFPEETPLIGGLSNEVLGDLPYTRGGWDQGPAYDPETARRLLDQAGWIDIDGDGVRERDGREARFTLLARQGYLPSRAPALLIQSQLRSVGVAAEIRPMQRALGQDAIRSGDFDAAVTWLDSQGPEDILEEWFGDPSPFGYYDAEAVRLLEVLRAGEPDLDAEDTLYVRLNEILRRDMPVTFLFPATESFVVNSRIRGFRQGLNISLAYADQLWIEEEDR